MSKYLSFKDIILVICISALFSQVSWWVLLNTEKAKQQLHPQIALSIEQAGTPTIESLPSAFLLAFIAYMPFWLVTFTLIKLFANLERRRSRSSPIYQQSI